MLVIRVRLARDGQSLGFHLTTPKEFDATDLFDGADSGEVYTLTAEEMSQRDYDQLDEFNGF